MITSKINMCCGKRFRPQLSASANNALPMLENQLLFSSREIRNKLLLLFPIFSFSQKNLVFKFCVQALLRICLVEFALKDQENFDHLSCPFIDKCSRLTARGSARGTKVRWGHLTEQWCWPRCDSWRQCYDAYSSVTWTSLHVSTNFLRDLFCTVPWKRRACFPLADSHAIQ